MLTADEARETQGVYKYVQLADGTFRFAHTTGRVKNADLVKTGEHAVSAGSIVIMQDYFRYLQYGSFGLDIGREDDQVALETALNLPGKHPKDMRGHTMYSLTKGGSWKPPGKTLRQSSTGSN